MKLSEIRCPMCGKPNPEEAEQCQYCAARLKPIWDGSSQQDSASIPAEPAEGDLPDWLRSLAPVDAGQEPPSEAEEPIPDWLKGLREDSSAEVSFDSFSESSDLSGAGLSSERQVPDWLKDIMPSVDQPPSYAQSKPDFEPMEDEDPDWLRRVGSAVILNKPADEPIPQDWAEEPEPAESIQGEGEFEPPAEEPLETALPAEPLAPVEPPLPAWLSQQEEEDILDWISRPEETETGEAGFLVEQGSNSLDWLSEKESIAEEPLPEPPEELYAAELPDWIADRLGSLEAENKTPDQPSWVFEEPAALQEPDQPVEANLFEPEGAGEHDEASPEGTPSALGYAALSLGASMPFIDDQGAPAESDLSWLDEIGAGRPESQPTDQGMQAETQEEPQSPVAEPADSYPAWLSEIVKNEEEVQLPAFSSDVSQEEISTAELPSWLKAMRPMGALDLEGGTTEELEEQAEKSGPLAGLIGALPAEPDIVQATRPPAYSLRIRLSETHQAHAALLAGLIEAEGVPKPLPQTPIIRSESLMRISIAVALIAAILLSMISGLPAFNPPPLTIEVQAASQLISDTPSGTPVLIAVDYSPGFSGEIAASLSSVAAQLSEKGANLVLVSTNPVGSVQAETLIQSLPGMETDTQSVPYTNLGFIPGGAAGIQAFAQDPRRILPYKADGEEAWADPALQSVQTIADFSMLVVAAENPDTVRIWIEQVQPLAGGVPILVLASAQNEPVIRPYYDAYPRQVQGLFGGLTSAVQFETLTGRPGAASAYWPALVAALTAAVLLILIGAALNFGLGFLARTNARKRAEGKG